ncbi:MAG: site-specific integrase [Candidatus Promineifilaceae bacterium]
MELVTPEPQQTLQANAALNDNAVIFAAMRQAVDAALAANEIMTRTHYRYIKAIERTERDNVNLTDAVALRHYANGLPNTSKAQLKAVLKRGSAEIEFLAKSRANATNYTHMMAIVANIQALHASIVVKSRPSLQKGHRMTRAQVEVFGRLLPPDDTVRGRRDRVLIGLMLVAGLRVAEATEITFDHITVVPSGAAALKVNGKGGKQRQVTIKRSLAVAIEAWGRDVQHKGRLARAIMRNGTISDKISPTSVRKLMRKYGVGIANKLGVTSAERKQLSALTPHDLRRTFAWFAYDKTKDIEGVSKLLGHSSATVTRRYIGLDAPEDTAYSDAVPFL